MQETTSSDRSGIAIAAQHISKQFGHVHALRDASVNVHYGEVVALFGDNGAGKSTFLRTLQGIHTPDAGQVGLLQDLVTGWVTQPEWLVWS